MNKLLLLIMVSLSSAIAAFVLHPRVNPEPIKRSVIVPPVEEVNFTDSNNVETTGTYPDYTIYSFNDRLLTDYLDQAELTSISGGLISTYEGKLYANNIETTGGAEFGSNVYGTGSFWDTLNIDEGTNCWMGLATLSSGSITVNTSAVTANSRIFLTVQDPNGTVGTPYISARTSGVSFAVTSTAGALDNSKVAWFIVEPY